MIDKPAGWTSMDVCAKVRGILHEKRVGHGGTLDPMATGVLPVFVGQATKAVEFAENSRKEYIAGLRLGLVTDTQDTTGQTLEVCSATVTRQELEAALDASNGGFSMREYAEKTRGIITSLNRSEKVLGEFDETLFEEIVEKVVVDSQTEVRFCLANGLCIKEEVEVS